jgi:GDP-L-fucose synthase
MSTETATATSAPANNCTDSDTTVVMVTGGSGLVGSALCDYIQSNNAIQNERWIFLSSADGDLRDRAACTALFELHRPTHVIHLAAKVGGLFANMKNKVEFFRDNVFINDNVMECCRLFGVKKLVSFLSTCIFPDKTTYPIDEGMLHDGPPHPSNEGYAYAKRLVDTMNRAYAEQYGCNFTSIIPTNIYGPQDNFNVDMGHVIPGLIHKCYLAKLRNQPFVIWGSGAPLRQFVYSRDLAELTVWTLRNYEDPSPITLSVDECDEVSIAQVATSVARAMEFTGEIVFDTSKADGQFKKTASNKKLRALLPAYKFTSMEVGVQESVDWFVKNYDSARK